MLDRSRGDIMSDRMTKNRLGRTEWTPNDVPTSFDRCWKSRGTIADLALSVHARV